MCFWTYEFMAGNQVKSENDYKRDLKEVVF